MWSYIWQALKALPGLIALIKQIQMWFAQNKKEHKEQENSAVRKEVENAETDEEQKKALEHVADRWGRQ